MWIKKDKCESIKEVFLRNIGVSSTEEVNDWFKKSYKNKWLIKGLKEAVEYVRGFKDQKVTIVGDYDCDGVTSTSILKLVLGWCGFTNVSYRIPKRFSEGFGINPTIIDEITEGLIITCDNGVAQTESIQKAKDKGLSVVIIDHHMPAVDEKGNATLPPADHIIDPNAIENSADFSGYCGAGLCLRFAREMLLAEGKENYYQYLIGIAAIGTVADVMELRDENYVIVKNGLKKLVDERYCTIGLTTLVNATCGDLVTAHDVGFKIGPVINAASRMLDDGAKLAVELITFNGDIGRAISMTDRLINLNDGRKKLKREANEAASQQIRDLCLYGDVPLILYLPKTAEGIIGIIAGNLCEKYKVPAIVLTDSENPDILKGSARSCGNCDIKGALDDVAAVSDSLYKYGGHEGAAGLSVYREKFDEFRNTLQSIVGPTFDNPDDTDDVFYDLEINTEEIPEVIEELAKYEPYGLGNAPVVFKINDFNSIPVFAGSEKYYSCIGDGGSIVKMRGNLGIEAIGFDMAQKIAEAGVPKIVNFVGTLSINRFNGRSTNQIEFSDFQLNDAKVVETPLAALLKEKAKAV